jgi:NDP-sugar pyrophosphorylase family protein
MDVNIIANIIFFIANVFIGIGLSRIEQLSTPPKQIIKYIPNRKFGLDNLINKLINKKIPINVFTHKGYWLDIGRPKDFEKANNDFSLIKSKIF